MIGVGHLLFDVEVGRGPQTLHDEVGSEFTSRVDGQTWKGLDANGREMGDTDRDEAYARCEVDHPGRLARIVHGSDDHRAEQFDRLLDDVEMADMERIETPRVQGGERR